MNIDQIEDNVKKLLEKGVCEETFIFDFLQAYGQPKAAISRLKKGDYNLSKNPGEILWKNKIFFKVEHQDDLHDLIDKLKNDQEIKKQKPRFIIVTDFKILLSIDTNVGNTLSDLKSLDDLKSLSDLDTFDILIEDLSRHFDFFLPLAGMEKTHVQRENLADRKAAEKLGKLYDLIIEDNSLEKPEAIHSLNVFLSRLLFCFFAEDTGIFSKNCFTNNLASHTSEDGSDLSDYLSKIFKVLSNQKRSSEIPQFLNAFPYVNGGLFEREIPVPRFSRKSRNIIIECGHLNWKDINPDIFGSMIQAVIHRGKRGNLGIHYTSVENIMKVIKPLFLNDLYEEFKKADDSKKNLRKLLSRLYNLRIFDPACGSGNFLIIAYKELCRLKIKILKKLEGSQMKFKISKVSLNQFYGIEIDDFAHETAKLSLYIAEHQMNLEFQKIFGESKPILPLGSGGNIVCENATRIEWEKVCPKDNDSEIYILGNPPYSGTTWQGKEQKNDLKNIFTGKLQKYGNLDYVSCWFVKASEYIRSSINTSFSFVSTNSICQGQQVGLLWPYLFNQGLEIFFAHQSFKWTNNAKNNAGVTCVIIGIRNLSKTKKGGILYQDNIATNVKNINAYLSSGVNIIVNKRNQPLSDFPKMEYGNKPVYGNSLFLSRKEKETLLSSYPEAEQYLRKIYGSKEFIHGLERWCLWIYDKDLNNAIQIPDIANRIDKVKESRLNSPDKAAHKLAEKPHQFREMKESNSESIIIPIVSSERRRYIPIDFLDPKAVISNKAFAVYNSPKYLFSVISSRMHMIWIRAVGGRLKTDYSYSSSICYNTFSFPKITDIQKKGT